jgi:hypothetical protein
VNIAPSIPAAFAVSRSGTRIRNDVGVSLAAARPSVSASGEPPALAGARHDG